VYERGRRSRIGAERPVQPAQLSLAPGWGDVRQPAEAESLRPGTKRSGQLVERWSVERSARLDLSKVDGARYSGFEDVAQAPHQGGIEQFAQGPIDELFDRASERRPGGGVGVDDDAVVKAHDERGFTRAMPGGDMPRPWIGF
jgi:hypothetical protein